MQSIPVDHNSGKKIESGQTVMLPFCRSVTDFSLPSNTQSILQGMVGFFLQRQKGIPSDSNLGS